MTHESFTIKKLQQNAIIPTRGSEGAAGYDLYTIESGIIPPLSLATIHTGLFITIPAPFYAGMFGRSGLAVKHGLEVKGDNIYGSGEIILKIYNNRSVSYQYNQGERIAQMVFVYAEGTPIEVVDELDDTKRGECGFGSTGK
ncbi:Deoxyuridine 5'-triphosphate nucleotidohydrolase [Astathelohania contejeani]|uniref:Deoxyuridine 5'-triphosphate nucleotidohydrolase n=1 Tax=Astathelohania contejeani TaxID=164912 RepID=A0ABQ7HYT5_9MICR|nr:Deoxyuridine 5'-triphosphate nucleotidohydrolase [Thelohania contejeani]